MTPLAAEKSDIKLGDQVMALVGGGGYAGTCTCTHVATYSSSHVYLFNLPYSQKYWRELNLADWPRPARR